MADLGHRPAFVLQDGCIWSDVPRGVPLFIGGSTDFKLGPDARELVRRGKAEGRWVHMGRVNSRRRMAYAHAIGCDSVDGTAVSMFPEVKLPLMLRWAGELVRQPVLDFS